MKEFMVPTVIVRLAATSLLLFATAGERLPYAYFQILRWIVCGAAIFCAATAYDQKHKWWPWPFVLIALLFNPIVSFHLKRGSWQVLDIAAGVVLLISLFFVREKKVGTSG